MVELAPFTFKAIEVGDRSVLEDLTMKLVASIIMLNIYILIATVAILLCAVFLGGTALVRIIKRRKQNSRRP